MKPTVEQIAARLGAIPDDEPRAPSLARRLSDADVAAIRASTETQAALGARYGVSQVAIGKIKRGVTYREPAGGSR